MSFKKIALISTYCDTQEKIDIFLQNIRKIKTLGIDVMAIGPNNLIMPDDVIKECDFFFYTKENPVLTYPERKYTHWFSMPLENGKTVTLHRGLHDYGWAALYQVKKLSEIALTFDYDVFYHIIYDLEITGEVAGQFLMSDANVIHPRIDHQDNTYIWESCLHFIVLDRATMKNIVSDIDYDKYLEANGFAEHHVEGWAKKYNLQRSNVVVKDLIHYWTGHNFFDYQIHQDFKFFVSKNPTDGRIPDKLRLVFYDYECKEPLEVIVIINGETYALAPKQRHIQELPISSQDVKILMIIYKHQIIDITDIYKNISFNQIYYN